MRRQFKTFVMTNLDITIQLVEGKLFSFNSTHFWRLGKKTATMDKLKPYRAKGAGCKALQLVSKGEGM